AKLLASQYDIVVTNPPYMGSKGMNPQLKKYLSDNYPKGKSDLFAAFMIRAQHFTVENGFSAAINQHSWMFLSSFEELRKEFLSHTTIYSMLHLGTRAFEEVGGEVVQSTSFVLRQSFIANYKGKYVRLVDYSSSRAKEEMFLCKKENDIFVRNQEGFKDIPGSPIAYWVSSNVLKIFKNGQPLGEFAEVKRGMTTSDNKRFLRFWPEVSITKVYKHAKSHEEARESKAKWFPYSKGGGYRKWYGFNEYLINWENSGQEVIEFAKTINKSFTRTIVNMSYYFKPSIGFSYITSGPFSMRWIPEGFLYDSGGPGVFAEEDKRLFILACMNSKPAQILLKILNPTINLQIADVVRLPLPNYESLIGNVQFNKKVKELIHISKNDWDSFETSWDFKKHPFLTYRGKAKTLEECYANWEDHAEKQFQQLKKNEEELNRIFIELYGLQDELTPEVPDEEITVRRADRVRDAKSFLSYCVGLMMGRYSLDAEGLAYAGGDWDASKYKTFQPDKDGIIPLTETSYFEDDVISRLQELLIIMFGEETLAENLRWLAESLTMKNNETPTERLRRYFFDEFYDDHCKIYQKRPIYWMVESGSKKGFRALFYLHRYTPETLATMRFTYVQNLQEKLRQEQKRLEQDLINPDLSSAMKKRYEKQLKQIRAQQEELVEFDKKLAELANQRIALDLDDGVVVNYEKLKTILAKIR
ncbi:BREX-1 system adenine-specific DNA-methyltransferase PglX, partial [Geobacillus sp. ZGt-1]|uniref:BREX-1 system adenine-specific DNA-methyltransferase PglX n=1 Tax=Geobacillus sp. ZGt-1 TaxID=1631556 RepID=UPI00064A038D